VDRGSNVDFQDFGVLVGFAMTQPALDEVGVPNLIERSPGSMEMKWRGSWPVWPVGLLACYAGQFLETSDLQASKASCAKKTTSQTPCNRPGGDAKQASSATFLVGLLCTGWLLFGGLLCILRNVRFHPNLPAFSTATKNYKYLCLVPTFLLPFFQNYPHQFLTSIRRRHGLQRPWKQARSRIRLWRRSRRASTKKTRFQHYCL